MPVNASKKNYGSSVRRIAALLLLLIVIPTVALAESAGELIPDDGLWGLSQTALSETTDSEMESCDIGQAKGLKLSGIQVDGYDMDAYYVFGAYMRDENGQSYRGLSKVVFLLSDADDLSDDELTACQEALVESMRETADAPTEEGAYVTSWDTDNYTIKIGRAVFDNYTGSAYENVGIVFSATNIEQPVIPTPTPKPTPWPKATREPTPEPTNKSKAREIDDDDDDPYYESDDE